MTNTMRVLRCTISVDQDWQVAIAFPELQHAVWGQQRTMRKLSDEVGGTFPLPPLEELQGANAAHPPACRSLCLASEPDSIRDQRRRIVDRDPDTEAGISPFGGYLFHSLIGPAAWKWIGEIAEANKSQCLELALAWDRRDANLNRLNWEMMHDGKSFLAAGLPGVGIAITRLIADTSDDRWRPRQLEFPPRVLFVVGTALNDPGIRPAAEFLGLLRELRSSGRRIRARVLEQARPKELERVIGVFKPEVVHFICHGDWDRDSGRGYLELAPDEPGGDRKRNADQLYASMTVGQRLAPPIVVLSACHSGTAEAAPPTVLQGVHDLAPLATELVAQGIPIVLGMAGRVSDLACRLFTRRLGDALVQGESLVAATADARRATVAQGRSAEETVDWAFPALFLAERVKPAYAPVREGAAESLTPEENWIRDYDLERVPVFCGRNEFFQAYYGFFSPDPQQVLAVVAQGDAGVGKTRLLQELAMQALRDGHIPILLSSEKKDWTAPRTIKAFGEQLRQAIRRVRGVLGVGSLEGQLTLLLRGETGQGSNQPALASYIQDELGMNGEVTALALRLALQADCFRLAKDARLRHEPIRQAEGRVLVLLDSVEQYDQVVDALFDHMLDPHGFGTRDEPIPAVLAFSLTEPAATWVEELQDRFTSRKWLRQLPLEPFRFDKQEDLLAYSWIVLNPFTERYPELCSTVRHVVNDRANEEVVRMARGFMKSIFQGLPGRLADAPRLYGFTMTVRDGEFVLPLASDDEDTMALAAVRIDPGQVP